MSEAQEIKIYGDYLDERLTLPSAEISYGAQKIMVYPGSHVDATRFKSNSLITKTTLKEVRGWLNKLQISHDVEYNPGRTINLNESDWWGERFKEMQAKGLKDIKLDVSSVTEENKIGSARFDLTESGDKIAYIWISKYCTSAAVVRAILMHEFIEVYTQIAIQGKDHSFNDQESHDFAYLIVKNMLVEWHSESQTRRRNLIKCLVELNCIKSELERRMSNLRFFDPFYLSTIGKIINCINNNWVIPGYYEKYEPEGYKRTNMSNIAGHFQRAKSLGIQFEGISVCGTHTLQGTRGTWRITLP